VPPWGKESSKSDRFEGEITFQKEGNQRRRRRKTKGEEEKVKRRVPKEASRFLIDFGRSPRAARVVCFRASLARAGRFPSLILSFFPNPVKNNMAAAGKLTAGLFHGCVLPALLFLSRELDLPD
jgi:hypothetical protein